MLGIHKELRLDADVFHFSPSHSGNQGRHSINLHKVPMYTDVVFVSTAVEDEKKPFSMMNVWYL